MGDADWIIGRLRTQVRRLQSLVNDLERRTVVDAEGYAYSRSKLRELIRDLQQLEQFSSERGAAEALRAVWLN